MPGAYDEEVVVPGILRIGVCVDTFDENFGGVAYRYETDPLYGVKASNVVTG